MGLFSSTADFYGKYRSGVPADVAEIVARSAPVGSPRRLVDVGTGTGFVIQALMPAFDEALGVDVDAGLLGAARVALEREISTGQVQLLQDAAESFATPEGWRPHLITVCRAFHWFDRPRFLAHAARTLVDGGTVAIFGDRSVWLDNAPWKTAILEVLRDFLGEERRAGDHTYDAPGGDYAEDLRDAGYRNIERQSVPVRRYRNVDSVIGYLHSTSFASPAVLGNAVQAFDDRIRQRLLPLSDEHGRLIDDNSFDILTATKPDDR